jgi:hypothetical protein
MAARPSDRGEDFVGEAALSPTKTSLAEKLLAFVVAAVYAAAVAYIIVGVTRRAAAEVRALRAERGRRKPVAPQLAAVMRRLLK